MIKAEESTHVGYYRIMGMSPPVIVLSNQLSNRSRRESFLQSSWFAICRLHHFLIDIYSIIFLCIKSTCCFWLVRLNVINWIGQSRPVPSPFGAVLGQFQCSSFSQLKLNRVSLKVLSRPVEMEICKRIYPIQLVLLDNQIDAKQQISCYTPPFSSIKSMLFNFFKINK